MYELDCGLLIRNYLYHQLSYNSIVLYHGYLKQKPHSKLLTDLERFNIVIKQSVSLPGSVDGLQNRDLGDELRKLKVSRSLKWYQC